MSFVSGAFMIFFPAVILGTWFIDRFGSKKSREIFLLAISYFFYGYWDWRFCFLLLFITIVAYYSAQHIDKKNIYIIALVTPLLVLGVFKYFNFFLDSVFFILGKSSFALKIILPVGISFYTFQALSYIIDVKRGTIPVEKDFVVLALYISFFPQLVAGPIVRAYDFIPQLYEDRKIQLRNVLTGIQIMAIGAFKKLVIADHISVFVDEVFFAPSAYHWATLYLGIVSCSIQIYMDFSGYSDIAIGCAHCLGYSFKRNFNLPYLSQSFTEFWSRWHISMSSWFTDYVFYPLATMINSRNKKIVAIVFTLFLSGLWHGAGWTFVVWGTCLGILLAFEKTVDIPVPKTIFGKITVVLIIFNINALLLIFFRSQSFDYAKQYIAGLFTLQDGVAHPFIWTFIGLGIIVLGYIIAIRRARRIKSETVDGFYPIANLNTIGGMTLFFTLIGLILILAYTKDNPFVYFNF